MTTYAAIFIDAIVVKVRDGQVANRPFYAAIGVTLAGERDILGLWAGTGGEGAKFWMSVLTDLRNRGVNDMFFVVCDGLKGLPEVVSNVWPQAIVQTCIIHLIRNTFRLTSRKYWDEIKRDMKPIYTAVNATAARAAFDELAEKWGQRYPAVIRLWDNRGRPGVRVSIVVARAYAMFAMSASALIGVRHGILLMATRRDRLVVSLNTQVTGCVLRVDP